MTTMAGVLLLFIADNDVLALYLKEEEKNLCDGEVSSYFRVPFHPFSTHIEPNNYKTKAQQK